MRISFIFPASHEEATDRLLLWEHEIGDSVLGGIRAPPAYTM
jgi:hypothetical protein